MPDDISAGARTLEKPPYSCLIVYDQRPLPACRGGRIDNGGWMSGCHRGRTGSARRNTGRRREASNYFTGGMNPHRELNRVESEMQVSVETTKGLERKLTVDLPADEFDSAYQERLRSLAKSAKLNGFRKGKVPLKVIRQRYGESVKQEILADMIQRSYEQALREKQLNPAGMPKIDSHPPTPGEDVRYTATVEVYPEFSLGDLSQIKVTRPAVEITDEDVDSTVDRLRKQHAEWKPVERSARQGDQVKIDFEGTVSGEPFEGNKGEDVAVVLGEGQMPEDFESQLEGIKAGENKTIKVKFPKDYRNEQLQGKKAVFEVTCKEVQEQELPELNEDFIKGFDIEDGSLDTFRDNIRRQLEKERDRALSAYVHKQVMDGLTELHDVELPRVMVDNQVEQLQRETLQRFGLKEDDLERLPRDTFEEQARRRVHVGLVASKLVSEKQIQVGQDAVRRKIEEAVADYENPAEMAQYYMNEPKAVEHFRFQAMEDEMVETVLREAKVEDKTMGFQDLMSLTQA